MEPESTPRIPQQKHHVQPDPQATLKKLVPKYGVPLEWNRTQPLEFFRVSHWLARLSEPMA